MASDAISTAALGGRPRVIAQTTGPHMEPTARPGIHSADIPRMTKTHCFLQLRNDSRFEAKWGVVSGVGNGPAIDEEMC